MSEYSEMTFNRLVEIVEQHEKTITQLVEIIGVTNRKVFKVLNNQRKILKIQEDTTPKPPNSIKQFH